LRDNLETNPEQQKWPLTSTTKMTIRGNWLHRMWTYFHLGIQNCFYTMPNIKVIKIFGQVEFSTLF